MHGILPETWGPFAWSFLHTIASRADQIPKPCLLQFFRLIGSVLPCAACRDHYRDHLLNQPLEEIERERKSVDEWLWNLHNRVNDSLGVDTSKRPSLADVRKRYSKLPPFAMTGVWQLLYAIAFGHPGANSIQHQQVVDIAQFFLLLPRVLPIEYRDEKRKMLSFIRETVGRVPSRSRPQLVRWVHLLQNHVSGSEYGSGSTPTLRNMKSIFGHDSCNIGKRKSICGSP